MSFLYSLEITQITSEFHNLGKFNNTDVGIYGMLDSKQYQVHLNFFKLNILSSSFKIWFTLYMK